MPNNDGPWGRKPSRFAARPGRVYVLLGVAAAGAAILCALSRLFPDALSSDLDRAYFVNTVGFLALVSAGVVMGRRFRTRETLRYVAIWAGIFAVMIVGYTFRDDLSAAGNPILGELIPSYPVASAHTLTLTESADGSFYTMGEINGSNATFLIDTGASDIVLSPADASRAGIDMAQLDYSREFETAHGSGRGASLTLERLSIGPINFRNVAVTVNESPMRTSLLGITFLRRLESFEIRGGHMTLRWRQ